MQLGCLCSGEAEMRLSTMNRIFRKIAEMETELQWLETFETDKNKSEQVDKIRSLQFSFAEFVVQFKEAIVVTDIEYLR